MNRPSGVRRPTMAFETILFGIDRGIARLTLNRPDRLNSFNAQMHAEVRQALDEVHRERRASIGADRCRARVLRRPGSSGSSRGAGRAVGRSGRFDRAALQAADPRTASAAAAR